MTNTPIPEEKKKCRCGSVLNNHGDCESFTNFIPSEFSTALGLLKSFLTYPDSKSEKWTDFEETLFEEIKLNFQGEILQTEIDAFCRNAMRNLIMKFENKLLAPYKSL